MPHRKCQSFAIPLARIWEDLIQILFGDGPTYFEWASRDPGKPVTKPVAHVSGERLQHGDQDAHSRVKHKIDTQRRHTRDLLPEVCSCHSRRHIDFLAFCLRFPANCGQFGDLKSR